MRLKEDEWNRMETVLRRGFGEPTSYEEYEYLCQARVKVLRVVKGRADRATLPAWISYDDIDWITDGHRSRSESRTSGEGGLR